MIGHVSIGVRDIAKAKAFYDAALKPIGYSCLSSSETSLGYGKEHAAFWILASPSPVPPDPQSGLHFCFTAPARESVDAFHRAAIGHGGRNNGKPGLRADYDANYYAAFVIDPDGYRIEAHCDKAA
jgi:catechol 2,3-dioxygenase-like lactoylglutathione lyase family enzyme